MKIGIQQLPSSGTAASAGESAAPGAGCASCPLIKACLPGNFNQREIQLFENVVAGRRRIARHASLFRKQDRLGMLYAVRFGQFKLIRGDQLGQQHVAGFHMAGDLVGLDGIATGQHDFRLMALENSEVCAIPFAALASVMGVEPAIQRKFLQTMSAALIEEHDHSILLSTTSLDERFATFLMRYGEKYARLGYSDKSFRLSMSRGDIGSYIGTTVESVSRLIARFNAQGAVSIDGRAVTLHDRDYLHALRAGGAPALGRAEALAPASIAAGGR